jgi:broad specificity phosphatase PhoE
MISDKSPSPIGKNMTFFITRHGHKEPGKYFNPILRHQDPPLSGRGVEGAGKLLPYFSKTPISAIYVSSYIRTRQTIEPLAKKLGLTPIEDERLNEMDNGLLDDMTEQEFEKAFPDEYRTYIARTADFRFPGGETGQEASARIGSFLEEKRETHKEDNIVIISHDGLIRVCMCHILGLPVFHSGDFKVDLCGITEIEFQADVQRWKLLRFNHVLQ